MTSAMVPPSFRIPRGVAVVVASTVAACREGDQRVMNAGQLISRTARPTRAGFAKLPPRPPNSSLATTMPNAEPTAAIHNGCLLYTSDAADDLLCVDLGGRRIIKKKKTTKNK